MFKKISCLLAIVLFGATLHAENFPVVAVIDGDTIVIRSNDGNEREIDLREVDAPEIGQPYGEEAKMTLSNLLENQESVTLQNLVKGPGLREKANVIIGHKDAAMTMLWKGAAWSENRGFNSSLLEVEKQAKKNKRGLWEQEKPTPPWDWRQHNTRNTNDINLGPVVEEAKKREAAERALLLEYKIRQKEAIERMKIEDPVGYAQLQEEKRYKNIINMQKKILNQQRNNEQLLRQQNMEISSQNSKLNQMEMRQRNESSNINNKLDSLDRRFGY